MRERELELWVRHRLDSDGSITAILRISNGHSDCNDGDERGGCLAHSLSFVRAVEPLNVPTVLTVRIVILA